MEMPLRATIWASLVAWALAEWWRGAGRMGKARIAWTVAALAAIVHAAVAFEVRHGWSHAAAYADTARQTAAVTSLDWGGGVYVNYVFLAAWAAHAAWWWSVRAAVPPRPRAVDAAMRGFAWFMFLNGAVVFGHGAVRWAGLAAIVAVTLAWYRGAGAERTAAA